MAVYNGVGSFSEEYGVRGSSREQFIENWKHMVNCKVVKVKHPYANC